MSAQVFVFLHGIPESRCTSTLPRQVHYWHLWSEPANRDSAGLASFVTQVSFIKMN